MPFLCPAPAQLWAVSTIYLLWNITCQQIFSPSSWKGWIQHRECCHYTLHYKLFQAGKQSIFLCPSLVASTQAEIYEFPSPKQFSEQLDLLSNAVIVPWWSSSTVEYQVLAPEEQQVRAFADISLCNPSEGNIAPPLHTTHGVCQPLSGISSSNRNIRLAKLRRNIFVL